MNGFLRLAIALPVMGLILAGPARAQIHVGMAGPLTGPYATFGEQMRNGAEAAVKAINESGGLLGQQLVLEAGDDACDPKEAVSVANLMAAKKIVAMFGHYCSGSSIPASSVYAEAGIIQITPASTNPKLTEAGLSNVFRVCGRDDQQGLVAGEYLAKHFKDKRIAIINDKSAYGKGLAEETQKRLNALGVKEVATESYTAGEKDYEALVTKLKNARVDVIYNGGYHTESALIIRQAREQGLKAILMSGDATVSQEFWSIAGAAGEGTLMTFSADPRRNPVAKKIVDRFHAAGVEPEGYVLYTYGAVEAWAQAVKMAGGVDTAKVAAALKSGSFETVLGRIGFDAKGDTKSAGYVVYSWRNGAYDYVTE